MPIFRQKQSYSRVMSLWLFFKPVVLDNTAVISAKGAVCLAINSRNCLSLVLGTTVYLYDSLRRARVY